MNAPTSVTASHVSPECGRRYSIMARAAPRESQRICRVQMTVGPLMFHKAVSVHINRSAHEIFKIYLFIEIFNAVALLMLQEAPGDCRPDIN